MKVTGLAEISVSKAVSCDAVRLSLLDTYSMMRERIFESGLDSNGGEIGKISTKPGYFNPKDFPKEFPTKGKNGFANSKKVYSIKTKKASKTESGHVTAYFKDGYKGAKQASGRSGKIDLRLTDDLRDNFLPIIECNSLYAFVFASDFAEKKATGNEERFKKLIFDPTEEEIQNFVDGIIEASNL